MVWAQGQLIKTPLQCADSSPDRSSQNPDEGYHPAGLFAIATVRMESGGIAIGAAAECVDVTRRDASANQLLSIDGGQIDAARACKAEPAGDVLAYFIAAGSNPRADRGDNLF